MIKVVSKKRILFISFAFVLFFNNVIGQKTVNLDTIENTVYLGKFKLKTPSLFKSKYTYDPVLNKYIYSTKLGDIDVGMPIVLTPEEYRKDVVSSAMTGLAASLAPLDAMIAELGENLGIDIPEPAVAASTDTSGFKLKGVK